MTQIQQIQDKIVKMLTDYKDVENVCQAFPHLGDTVNEEWFQEMRTAQVAKKVL